MHAYIYFSGLLDEYLQKYGSLIPVHSDDIAEELKGIFNEEFSQPHRSHTCTTLKTNISSFVHTYMHLWKVLKFFLLYYVLTGKSWCNI